MKLRYHKNLRNWMVYSFLLKEWFKVRFEFRPVIYLFKLDDHQSFSEFFNKSLIGNFQLLFILFEPQV